MDRQAGLGYCELRLVVATYQKISHRPTLGAKSCKIATKSCNESCRKSGVHGAEESSTPVMGNIIMVSELGLLSSDPLAAEVCTAP